MTVRLCVAKTAQTSSTWTFVHVLAWNIGANGLSAGIIASGRACPVPDTGVSMTRLFVMVGSCQLTLFFSEFCTESSSCFYKASMDEH